MDSDRATQDRLRPALHHLMATVTDSLDHFLVICLVSSTFGPSSSAVVFIWIKSIWDLSLSLSCFRPGHCHHEHHQTLNCVTETWLPLRHVSTAVSSCCCIARLLLSTTMPNLHVCRINHKLKITLNTTVLDNGHIHRNLSMTPVIGPAYKNRKTVKISCHSAAFVLLCALSHIICKCHAIKHIEHFSGYFSFTFLASWGRVVGPELRPERKR